MLESKAQTIVGQRNLGREGFVGFLPSEFVSEMGEEGSFWFKGGDGVERLGDGHVSVVFLVTEGVDDEHVQILQEIEGTLRNNFHIRNVGKRADGWVIEAETVGPHPAMLNFNRCDFEVVESECVFHGAGIRPDIAWLVIFQRKCPGIHPFESG